MTQNVIFDSDSDDRSLKKDLSKDIKFQYNSNNVESRVYTFHRVYKMNILISTIPVIPLKGYYGAI